MTTSLPKVEINGRGATRLRGGHVWVYRSDIRDSGTAQAGDIVRLQVKQGKRGPQSLGCAFFNPQSLLALRLITRQRVVPDRAYWRSAIQLAAALRADRIRPGAAARLVHAEADEIPGLIVDRYDSVLVVQTLCAGTDRLKGTWVELLREAFEPSAIVERNDGSTRKLEGLGEQVGLLYGRLDGPVEIEENGLRLLVDPLHGQKTGNYLDQRENRARAATYARGRCLDVFSYQGGFGLMLKRGGADEVTLVDQSERALQAAQATARLNRLSIETVAGNAFDFLKKQQRSKERYDVISLDPPAFAKNRDAVERAARGYKEINLRALQMLNPGGTLITSSCSYHMQPDHFEEVLRDASRDSGRVVQILERRSQATDHPERLGVPESRYLKCYIVRAL